MKVKVDKNQVPCPEINRNINHMECNDDCFYFGGCSLLNDCYVVECSYNNPKMIARPQLIELACSQR